MGDASGRCGNFFLVTNLLLWLVGFGTLGYAIWILVTSDNASEFLSGTLVFTYSFLGIGILLAIIGLLGCIGVCAESICCLKAYIGLMLILLIVDIGVAIAGGLQSEQVLDITENLWGEINTETKYQIQKELECCAYKNVSTEYTAGSFPDSCYGDPTDPSTLHTTTCDKAMEEWVKAQIPIWASVVGAILLIQILSMIASCLTLKNIEDHIRIRPV